MLYKVFGVLALIFFIIWICLYAVMLYMPLLGLLLSIPMMITGAGAGIFFILFIVLLVIRR